MLARGGRGNGCERVFAALSRMGMAPGATAALKLLVPFIDTALRQMPHAPSPQAVRQFIKNPVDRAAAFI